MKGRFVFSLLALCMALLPVRAMACAEHLYFNPDEMGFFGGAMVRLAGLAPQKPVFELVHPAMARAVIGEDAEIAVEYSRPLLSKDVRLELRGTKNVELSEEPIELEHWEGSLSIPYQVSGAGFDSITLTIVGTVRGKEVKQVGRVYLRTTAKQPEADQELKVSGR